MDFKIFLGIPLGIALLYYGIFKLRAKENLLPKILVLVIAIAEELAVVGKLLFKETIIFPIVLIGGLIATFSVMTIIAWNERKNPDKQTYVYVYFPLIGFIGLFGIVTLILVKTGFFE